MDIIKINRSRILDQISNDGSTLSITPRSYFIKALKEKHGLNDQEYYNLIVYGDKNNTPKCLNCNNLLPFLSMGVWI